MGKLFLIVAIAAVGYGWYAYAPAGASSRLLASVGLERLFTATLPDYLRAKLSIPRDPAKKRAELLVELRSTLDKVQNELGRAASAKGSAPAQALADAREHAEKAAALIGETETIVENLRGVESGNGFFREVAERALDKLLPPPAAGTNACEQK